jgi:hypothetical protein
VGIRGSAFVSHSAVFVMAQLPKLVPSFTDDVLHRIAMDIGKQVVDHIESAHPEMLRAVISPTSTKRSIRNSTYNAIMAAVRAADRGQHEQSMARNDKHRRTMRKIRKAQTIDELVAATKDSHHA